MTYEPKDTDIKDIEVYPEPILVHTLNCRSCGNIKETNIKCHRVCMRCLDYRNREQPDTNWNTWGNTVL